MCFDMGGGVTLSGEVGSQGVIEKGRSQGVHSGLTKRGVHVHPMNPLATA